ncbi:MAG TPA: hypothetical protein DCE52_16065 [Rhodobacteraceae bacterium]|nr:hypothetical protein [Paracoccaceae bacterium]
MIINITGIHYTNYLRKIFMKELAWLKRINSLDSCVGGSHKLIKISFEEIVKFAKDSTQLDDFGDNSWISYLNECLKSEASLNENSTLIRLIFKAQTIMRIRNRLLLVDHLKRNPEIKNESIDSPVFITGLPRSGTTILFELLSQDPLFEAPLGYDTLFEMPSPGQSETQESFRKGAAECLFELTMDIIPDLKSKHDHRHDLPVECADIMANIATIPHPKFDSQGTYEERVGYFKDDVRYKWHKLVLQTLQYRSGPKTWLLKDLFHIHFLNLVFKLHPKARIIHTHRDPISVIPSLLSLLNSMGSMYPEYQVKNTHQVMSLFEGGLRKSIEQRENNPELNKQIADIHFSKLLTDPIDSIKLIYKKFDINFYPENRDMILKYLKFRPRQKYGGHSYSLSDFGLSESVVRRQFKFYTDYYHIPTR